MDEVAFPLDRHHDTLTLIIPDFVRLHHIWTEHDIIEYEAIRAGNRGACADRRRRLNEYCRRVKSQGSDALDDNTAIWAVNLLCEAAGVDPDPLWEKWRAALADLSVIATVYLPANQTKARVLHLFRWNTRNHATQSTAIQTARIMYRVLWAHLNPAPANTQ